GRLAGTVVAEVGGKALSGARVRITDGPETSANERGEWTLAGVPFGTRMLEVRAVGYYPKRVAVDVLDGAPQIRTALSTMGTVLDTVRIRASRLNASNVSGFAERRHIGLGRYLTPEQIARRNPINISDMFYMVPGLRLDRVGFDTRITMRGIWGRCSPALYLDGQYLRGLSTDDINSWVSPDEVAGIEIYSPGMVPPQFEPGMSGCGSIVVWTGQRSRAPDPRPFRQRLFTVLGAITLGLVVGATLR
ncbi:MAG: Plug and carboxypeptidase regulatory-like domain-containing protein, partial [Gemmatimonadaceae bacterium]|nr:Plug and carboxypeptidase regulatory-like domain-containing protein [Gemmatimonadaceae bacterium]